MAPRLILSNSFALLIPELLLKALALSHTDVDCLSCLVNLTISCPSPIADSVYMHALRLL